MKEIKRKVIFNLNEQGLGILEDDGNDNNSVDVHKERQGLFHRWGDVVWYDPNTEKYFQKTIAIVEETPTGIIHEVSPHCIKFIP